MARTVKLHLIKWPYWCGMVPCGDYREPTEEERISLYPTSQPRDYCEQLGDSALAQDILDQSVVREVEIDLDTLDLVDCVGPILNLGNFR